MVVTVNAIIICDGPHEWYAQGIEVDHLAEGHSKKDVKRSFRNTLKLTVNTHINQYGELRLKPASQHTLSEFFKFRSNFDFYRTRIAA